MPPAQQRPAGNPYVRLIRLQKLAEEMLDVLRSARGNRAERRLLVTEGRSFASELRADLQELEGLENKEQLCREWGVTLNAQQMGIPSR